MGGKDPLKESMATHFSILAWRILWTEEPGRLQSTGSQELDTTARMDYPPNIRDSSIVKFTNKSYVGSAVMKGR